jgi:hypothetical protein
MFPVNQNFVSANAGLSNGNNPCFPMYLPAAPTSQTIYAPYGVVQVGQIVVVPAVGAWICLGLLASVSGLTATWEQFISSTGDLLSLITDSGTATPTVGAITISGGTTGLTTSASGSTIDLTGTLGVPNGGTGIATATAYTLIAAGTTAMGAFQHLASVGTSGQYLVSNGAAALPTFQTATPQLVVTPVAGATQAMLSNHIYIANDSAKTTFTLPTTSAVGDIIGIVGSQLNTGGWAITYTTGQIIYGPNEASTITTGNLTSTAAYGQAVKIICTVANTTWVVQDNSGGFTVA